MTIECHLNSPSVLFRISQEKGWCFNQVETKEQGQSGQVYSKMKRRLENHFTPYSDYRSNTLNEM